MDRKGEVLAQITNHSELYLEVLNSLNKNASNEMSEYLHDKIHKHATKQASQGDKWMQ